MVRCNAWLLFSFLSLAPRAEGVKQESPMRDNEAVVAKTMTERSTRVNGSALAKPVRDVILQSVNRRPHRASAMVDARGRVIVPHAQASVHRWFASSDAPVNPSSVSPKDDDSSWFTMSSSSPGMSSSSPESSLGWMSSPSSPSASSFGAYMTPHWKYINNRDVGQELWYPKHGSSVPECWQGLFFMDQNFMTADLLDDTSYYFTSNVYGRDIPDYAISVLDKWDGSCVYFGYLDRSSWGYQETKMNALMGCPPSDAVNEGTTSFCLDNYLTHSPCDEGAIYSTKETRDQMGYHMSMTMEKKSWGWDRVTKAEPTGIMTNVVSLGASDYYHYPVVAIIDKFGNQTKYFETYVREANNDFDCVTEGTSQIMVCPKNENEYGKSLICTTHV